MKSKWAFYLMFIYSFLIVTSYKSFACTCVTPPPPNVEYQNSSAVFMGVVDTIKVDTIRGYPWRKVILTIDKSWKGTSGNSAFVFTAMSDAACGYYFVKGGKYLVYCYSTNDTLRTSICSRTRSDFEASEDLAYLSTLSVKDITMGSTIPTELVLFQNYPNPANPSTVFRFDIPQPTTVMINLYNSLGQKIVEIFSGFIYEGIKEINWSGSQLPSGIYVVRLQTDYGTQSIKTLLIK